MLFVQNYSKTAAIKHTIKRTSDNIKHQCIYTPSSTFRCTAVPSIRLLLTLHQYLPVSLTVKFRMATLKKPFELLSYREIRPFSSQSSDTLLLKSSSQPKGFASMQKDLVDLSNVELQLIRMDPPAYPFRLNATTPPGNGRQNTWVHFSLNFVMNTIKQ